MLFNSPLFIFGFLPIVLVGCFILVKAGPRYLAIGWLLACSLFFYGWFKPIYLILLVVSMLTNYYLGERIVSSIETERRRPAKVWLILGLLFNLGLLGYFKYFNFFIDTVNAVTAIGWSISDILLPIGISFFTFQKIAYLMDCHAGIVHRTNLLKYMLFVMYFPQLIAGPIVHPKDILPQLDDKKVLGFQTHQLTEGLAIFILGLGKKVILADQFGVWANEGFHAAKMGEDLTLLPAWVAVLSYTLQIYFDFSGYSDMAIGLAWMVGIRLPINFRSPYKAASIIDFWRNWHITLSTFLRDYLYIPLGGSRRGPTRRWLNLLITMLIGGLWHGASWTFVFWGFLHGLFLAINHAWLAIRDRVPFLGKSFGPLGKAVSWCLTMLSVIVAWTFFRSESFHEATSILKGMAGLNGILVPDFMMGHLHLSPWISGAAKIPHLAGGTIIGLMEVGFFLILGWGIVLIGRPLEKIPSTFRYLLLIPVFSLTLQKILVSHKPSTFLYFQF